MNTREIRGIGPKSFLPIDSIDLPGVTIVVKYVNMTDIFSRPLDLAKQAEPKRPKSRPERDAGPVSSAARLKPVDQGLRDEPAERALATGPTAVEPELLALVELFFFAYRDFTGEPDAILAEYKLGRAHHRVLHFVNRNPGLRVADLLELLKVTKQSLARVLKTLVDQGWVEQISGADDRRERLLYLTARGTGLANKLAQMQLARVHRALKEAGANSSETVQTFLFQMIGVAEREHIGSVLSPAVSRKSKA